MREGERKVMGGTRRRTARAVVEQITSDPLLATSDVGQGPPRSSLVKKKSTGGKEKHCLEFRCILTAFVIDKWKKA